MYNAIKVLFEETYISYIFTIRIFTRSKYFFVFYPF